MSTATNILVFVTGNQNKLREVQAILGADPTTFPFTLQSKELDIREIQGSTQDVAREKCKRAAELIGGPCITEDTALCFKAMHGLPGPYIKYFLKELGHEGINKMLDGFETRDAHALCTFAYCAGAGQEPILFEGKTDGRIVPARGDGKFGWDPVFEAENTGKTYAEMPMEEKNLISHRYRALDKLRTYLQTLGK